MPHPKHLLVVEDDQDYKRLVCEVLAESFEVESASTLAAGLASIEERKPEVVLIDLNLPDSSGYETFLRIRERTEGIPIIVLTGLDDDHTAVHAIEDGAQDYLVKNLIQPRLISRCVNMAVSRHSRQTPINKSGRSSPGAVLAFIGSKGGVGTSTVAINVAASLVQSGLDTIVIEVGSGVTSTLSLYLDRVPGDALSSLSEKPADAITLADFEECLIESVCGLRLCPFASARTWQRLGTGHVQAIISAARRASRFLVLDLPARMDNAVELALKSSDSITMVVDRELASLHGAAALLEQIRAMTSHTRNISVAMVDRTRLEEPPPLADINVQLKMPPLAVIPSAVSVIAFSQSARMPVVLVYPDDPFSLAHVELTQRLVASVSPELRGSLANARAQLNRTARWRVIPETTYG